MTNHLTALAALEAQATKGPWTERRKAVTIDGDGKAVYASDVLAPACDIAYRISRPEKTSLPNDRHIQANSFDAAFICAARNALPTLLELGRLHREWVEAREAWKEARRVSEEEPVKEWQAYLTAEAALSAWTGGRA